MGNNHSNYYCINDTEKSLYSNNNTNDTYPDCEIIIGYSENGYVPAVFLVLSVTGLILNLYLIIDYFRKKSGGSSRKQSSMKKLFNVLPVLDSITCVYWILSSSIFWKAEVIKNHINVCLCFSILYISVFTFEFIFINFILIHFRKISLNPIEGILKPEKNILIYFIISVAFTVIVLALSLIFEIMGRSPMYTCFINTEQSKQNGFIFLIPIATILSVIIQVIYDLFCREMFVSDKEVRLAYKNNIIYVLIFTLMHIPMLVLINITAGKEFSIKEGDKVLRTFAHVCTCITCSIPMVVGIFRNCKGFSRIKQIKKLQRKLTRANIEGFNPDMSKPFNDSTFSEDQFDWLEKHAMEFFMRDILLGIAHCLHNSKQNFDKDEKLDLQNKENKEIIKHHITFDNFVFKEQEKAVVDSGYLNINIIEYAPKIFARLRQFENIDIDNMIESFLPKNNKQGISESQGKSGSFFISTDDNYYMVKTLRADEFELIRHTFLNQYVQYISNNRGSLLCRIYGMYNIILSQGEEILIIVMRNVLGDFKDNIIAKYDLKGSTANRKSKFDMEKSDSSTMKDLNFNEFEHGIMISRENIEQFRKVTRADSTFLSSLDLMDYSVFLVKLTLSKEEEMDIFGQEIRERKDDAFNNLISQSINSTEGGDNNVDSDDSNLKINDTVPPRFSVRGEGKIFKIEYYKQYLFPSLTPGIAYILAIIDYFQLFNFYKYVESGLKTKMSKNPEGVSCVDPKTYSKRFIKYFEKLTDIKSLFKDGAYSTSTPTPNPNETYDNQKENEQVNNMPKGGSIELQAFN